MATREAGIKVTLKSGAYSAGLDDMKRRTKQAGDEMGRALSVNMKQGLGAATNSMRSMMSSVGGMMRTALTLGGAVSVGALVKDAIQLQGVFRNIAFTVNK